VRRETETDSNDEVRLKVPPGLQQAVNSSTILQEAMSLQLTADGMLELGLTIHNQRFVPSTVATDRKKLKQVETFRSFYGIDPKSCLDVYKELKELNLIAKPNPYDFLMTVEWLRKYREELDVASIYRLSVSTVSKLLWRYTHAIQALCASKIKWIEDWNNPDHVDEIMIISVDGVHCTIREPRQMPSSSWFSHKTHGPALSYEIAIAIQHNKVVHINGPFPAGVPDITIFRKEGGLKSRIPDGKYGTADRGYLGEPTLRTPNPRDTQLAKDFKKRSQARHETFNSRLKNFKILSTRFRHRHTQHGKLPVTCHDNHRSAFEAVCVLLQFDMENGHPLFPV
jgi:DDE superfamily endonuclease